MCTLIVAHQFKIMYTDICAFVHFHSVSCETETKRNFKKSKWMRTRIIHTAIKFPGEMIRLVFMATSTSYLTSFIVGGQEDTLVVYVLAAWEKQTLTSCRQLLNNQTTRYACMRDPATMATMSTSYRPALC